MKLKLVFTFEGAASFALFEFVVEVQINNAINLFVIIMLTKNTLAKGCLSARQQTNMLSEFYIQK